jgi:hypothetical protein
VKSNGYVLVAGSSHFSPGCLFLLWLSIFRLVSGQCFWPVHPHLFFATTVISVFDALPTAVFFQLKICPFCQVTALFRPRSGSGRNDDCNARHSPTGCVTFVHSRRGDFHTTPMSSQLRGRASDNRQVHAFKIQIGEGSNRLQLEGCSPPPQHLCFLTHSSKNSRDEFGTPQIACNDFWSV